SNQVVSATNSRHREIEIKPSPVVFFPSLNSLRFFAAFSVFVYHLELKMERCGMEVFLPQYLLHMLGEQGVYLFFVLSSFLLPYILITEGKTTGTVSVKDFYFRRALRIWPLYLVIIGIAFFLAPAIAPTMFHPAEAKRIAANYASYPQ